METTPKNDNNVPILVKKGQEIVSKRTGRKIQCYSVMSVCSGNSNTIIRFEYSFWDTTTKKSRTIKQSELREMLNGIWSIVIKN